MAGLLIITDSSALFVKQALPKNDQGSFSRRMTLNHDNLGMQVQMHRPIQQDQLRTIIWIIDRQLRVT